MTSAQDPWPPDDLTAAMLYDQRGCCWPRGPCPYAQRLQMRYTAIAFPDAGVLDDAWAQWKTGQLFVVDLANSDQQSLFLKGWHRPGTASNDTIHFDRFGVNEGWRGQGQTIVGIGPDIGFTLLSGIGYSICTATVALEVKIVDGPAPLPVGVFVTPLPWWSVSPFPYGGTL